MQLCNLLESILNLFLKEKLYNIKCSWRVPTRHHSRLLICYWDPPIKTVCFTKTSAWTTPISILSTNGLCGINQSVEIVKSAFRSNEENDFLEEKNIVDKSIPYFIRSYKMTF